MKTIGLIGGMSWESSLEYYRIINQEVNKRLGGHHSADCLMYSVDFDPVKKLQYAGEWETLTSVMTDAALRLKKGGAELISICTNTMHMMAGEVEKKSGLPLVHIIDSTAEVILSHGLTKVLLLGTRFTMEQIFYRERLEKKHGIEVLIPDANDINVISDIIYNELVLGVIRDESKNEYLRVISQQIREGAQGVILGCTEIPLLIKQEDSPIPVFDTTTIHAIKTVEAALK